MSTDRSRGCGAHDIGDTIPGSTFDYTCDDCVLPDNHLEYDESPDYYDSTNTSQRIRSDDEEPPALQDNKGARDPF